jgi:hypothetical protein
MALCGAILPAAADTDDDAAAIRALIVHTWDKPGARLVVEPIVVVGEHAVAGWTQVSGESERGGRALLRKHGGAWTVVLCSGDALKHAEMLTEAGVPSEAAVRIAAALATAEHGLDPARVKLLSTFEGVMRMGEEETHK